MTSCGLENRGLVLGRGAFLFMILKVSRRWRYLWWTSGLWRRVNLQVGINVSKGRTASSHFSLKMESVRPSETLVSTYKSTRTSQPRRRTWTSFLLPLPPLSDRLWGPPILLYNGYRRLTVGSAVGAWSYRIRLVPTSRMRGSLPRFSQTSSWSGA